MISLLFQLVFCSSLAGILAASKLHLTILYPEIDVKAGSGHVFSILISSAPLDQPDVPPWGFFNESYYVYDKDKVAPNTWSKNVTVEDSVGTVYLNIMGVTSSYTVGSYSVRECNLYKNWIVNPYCVQSAMPWQVNMSASSDVALKIYPSFGATDTGTVSLLFENFFSPQLQNYRNITIYVPKSVRENYLTRNISVMVLNDGDIDPLYSYSFLGGFDVAVNSGLAPESIIIGVANTDILDSCQRNYELSYAPCNTNISSICQSAPACYGGIQYYLDFIMQTVIPTVMQNISMGIGEVSIMGFSMGGLAAAYAVYDRPHYFSRALCLSPSLWYNNGELASMIISKFKAGSYMGPLPKAIVFTLGTAEDGYYVNPSNSSDVNYWSDFIRKVTYAWKDVGVVGTTSADSTVDGANLFFFTVVGGIHSIQSLNNFLYEGVRRLYQSHIPVQFRRPLYDHFNYIFPASTESSTCSGDGAAVSSKNNEDNLKIGLYILLILFIGSGILNAILYRKLSNRHGTEKIVTHSTSNIINESAFKNQAI
jgi:predicted alpha/beta superfamily hydrolase